jgi:hypothetical protein
MWNAYNTTLDRSEQVRQFVQMMKLRSEELPSLPLYYSLNVVAHVAALRGPEAGVSGSASHWNIYEWEFK